MTMPTVSRPFGVALLSVLLIVSGVLDIIAGIVLIIAHDDADVREQLRHVSSASIATFAIVIIVLGVIAIVAGVGLRSGANWARLFVGVVAALRLISVIWGVIAYHGLHWYQGLLPAAIYLLVASYLFSNVEVKRFFNV